MIEFTSRTLGKLRNAQIQLVEEAGPQKVMEITGKSKSVVYRWSNDTASELMSPAEVMQVEGHLRRPIVSQEMVWFLGLETSGASPAPTPGSLSLHVGELVEHVSRLVVETARAKADGVVTTSEANRLLDLLASAERLIPAIKDTLVGVRVDGPLRDLQPDMNWVKGGAA